MPDLLFLKIPIFSQAEMEVLKMKLDAEKQDHIAKLYALAVAKGEKLDPKSLPYQEVSFQSFTEKRIL